MQTPPWEDELELLVVLTCFRCVELTIDCLHTLEPELREEPRIKVMICENGSGDGALEALDAAIRREGWGSWVVVRPVHPNRGFAGGNNVVLSEALGWPRPPRHFLLLNTDTLVRPGAIRGLLDAAEQHPEAGLVGPRLEHADGTPQVSCFRFISPLGEMLRGARTGPLSSLFSRWVVSIPVSDEPMEPDWLSFACVLIRLDVMRALGPLDENYYLYYDDVDYCRMARDAGFGMRYEPRWRVCHLVGQSNPVEALAAERKRRPRYYYASRSRYFAKFYGLPGLWLANLLWLAGRTIALLRETLGSKPRHSCDEEWRDVWINGLAPMRPPEERTMQGRAEGPAFG